MYMVSSWKSNQERAKRKGQSSQETVTGKRPPTRKNISVHPLHHLTQIELKTHRFAHGALSPWVLRDGPPVSPQLDTGNVYSVLIFRSCSASLLVGTEATLLLSAWMQPCYPEAWALMVLRRQSSRQLLTGQSLKAKRPAPAGQRGLWRPPAGHRRRAGSPVLTDLRGLTQKQLCCEHSDWKPKLKWSRIAPWPSAKHG